MWEWKFNFAKENMCPKSKSYFFSFSLSPTIFVFPLLPPHFSYNRLKNNCVITFSTQEIWLTARGQETPRKARWIDKYYISSCVIVLVFCQHLWEIYIGHDHRFQIIHFPLKAPQFSNWETGCSSTLQGNFVALWCYVMFSFMQPMSKATDWKINRKNVGVKPTNVQISA